MKITLVGSTQYASDFEKWNIELSLKGHLVYSLATVLPRGEDGQQLDVVAKRKLDHVYREKIRDSDAIVVIHTDRYVGEGTRAEIEWAALLGKEIFWTEDPKEPRTTEFETLALDLVRVNSLSKVAYPKRNERLAANIPDLFKTLLDR